MGETSPIIRQRLIECRSMAMLGRVDAALGVLDNVIAASKDLADAERLALLLLKAELLYLDCREPDALAVFENEIEGKLPSISQEERFVVGQNKREVIFGGLLASEGRRATFLYDQQHIAGTKFWNASAIVHAYESARSARHYEALPALWRELLSAYEQRVWSYYRQAAKRVAQEFIQIGWANIADFYVVVGQDLQAAGTIAEHLLSWRNVDFIDAVVHRLMLHANLKRHAIVACGMFIKLADVVRDEQLTPITRWLLQRASIVPSGFSDLNLVNGAWDALTALAPRFNSEMAREVVKAATSHKSWKETKGDRVREHMVRTVGASVSVLPSDDLPALVKESIHMAVGMSEDINLDAHALQLFRDIAERSDTSTKELIRDALYDKPSANFVLLTVAAEFGKSLESKEEAQRLAKALADDLRLQVQHLGAAEEFKKPVVSLGQMTLTAGPKKVAVSIYSDIGLRAIIAHRKVLNKDAIGLLIDSVLDMLHEPENTLANKVLMINAITGLADVMTVDLAEKAFLILEPIASGVVTSLDLSHVIAPNHPLNPNTMNLGNQQTVQGGALLALAIIEGSLSSAHRARVPIMVEEAMTNPDPEVRTLAFIAARRLPVISDSALMKILLATRDNVADIVIEAFLILNDHMRDTDEFWNSLAHALKIASQSPQAEIRRVVAFTIRNLLGKCKNEVLTNQLTSMKALLENDISYAVRKELSGSAA